MSSACVLQDSEVQSNAKEVSFPVYRTSDRDYVITTLAVPCEGQQDEWFKAGPAFFLRDAET